MCGIVGVVDFRSGAPEETLLGQMLARIRHRGPDSFGIYRDVVAGLGSARLSILDLEGGDQPIHNEDESVWIVYNGELFNYPELREDLEKKGHRFYTRTDTEILVHAYEEKGCELFEELNGQFAFALWDRRRELLLLGRDRLGIRPLFYTWGGERLAFASEVKSLFEDPAVPRSIDLRTLSDIFTCWSPLGGDTVFEGVRQLLPGHYALVTRDGMTVRPYWQLSFSDGEEKHMSLGACAEELDALLYDATRIRLRADVPVGAYLSGGLDSTLITALVKKRFNNGLRTFSVSFSEERFDEAVYQSRAVEALGTEHRSIRCTERDIGEAFPHVIWHTELPILRTAPAPLFNLSRLAHENGFKVVLTGEGSDEIFAGYDIFKEDRVRRFWARMPESKMRPKLIQKLYPDIFSPGDGRSRLLLEGFFRKGLENVASPVYSHSIRWENTGWSRTFFSESVLAETGGITEFSERLTETLPGDFMKWNPLSRAQYLEIVVFLSNYLLSSQGDRMAMGNSVEGRFPFLDYRVVEFATRIPPAFRLNGLRDKFILRKIGSSLIPDDVACRPKQPYRAPISRCFFGEKAPGYVAEVLSGEHIRKAGYFNGAKVGRLVEKCRRQEGHLLSERENMALVGILSTQLVHDQFIENFACSAVDLPGPIKAVRCDAIGSS